MLDHPRSVQWRHCRLLAIKDLRDANFAVTTTVSYQESQQPVKLNIVLSQQVGANIISLCGALGPRLLNENSELLRTYILEDLFKRLLNSWVCQSYHVLS